MSSTKAQRNDPCPCGSGKKYKKCCALKKGMQKYQTEVISSGEGSLLGRISAFGTAMKERQDEIDQIKDKKINAQLKGAPPASPQSSQDDKAQEEGNNEEEKN